MASKLNTLNLFKYIKEISIAFNPAAGTGTRGLREFLTRTQSNRLRLSNPRLKVKKELHFQGLPITKNATGQIVLGPGEKWPVSLQVLFVNDQLLDFEQKSLWGANADDIVRDVCQVAESIEIDMEERGETIE